LHYLARYSHRVAISNHRLIAFDGESVTFRWKDYAHGNKKRKMTVSADEFLRRFLLHTLPRGFVRIRFFGFPAGPRRAKMLQLARQLLQAKAKLSVPAADPARASFPCPVFDTRWSSANGSRRRSSAAPASTGMRLTIPRSNQPKVYAPHALVLTHRCDSSR
jgi:hypothetical protein